MSEVPAQWFSKNVDPHLSPWERLSFLLQNGLAERPLTTSENRRMFLNELGPGGFEAWTAALNQTFRAPWTGQVTGFESGDHALAGETPETPGYIPPQAEDRRQLLYEAYETATQVPDMEQASVLLGATIAICRPFAANNNATAIAVQQLLSHGYDGSLEDGSRYSLLFGNDAPHDAESRRFRRGLGHGFAHDLAQNFCNELTYQWRSEYGLPSQHMTSHKIPFDSAWVDPNLPSKSVDALRTILRDDIFSLPLFVEFVLRHKPEWHLTDYYNPQHTQGDPHNTEELYIENIVWMLNEAEVEQLSQRYHELKRIFVHQIMVSFDDTRTRESGIWWGPNLVRSFLSYGGITAILETPR